MEGESMTQSLSAADFAELIAELDDEDPARLEHRLRDLKVDTQAVANCFTWNGDEPDPLRVFEDAVAAVPDRIDRALLSLWVRQCGLDAWENSYHLSHLTRMLSAFEKEIIRSPDTAGPDPLMHLMLLFNHLLAKDIQIEDQLCTGSFDRYEAAIESALGVCDQVDGRAEAAAAPECLTEFVQGWTEASRRYYSAILASSAGVRAALAGEWGQVDASIRSIDSIETKAVEEELFSFVERSEIRAHRRSLQRLSAARDEAWLRVDQGRIAYLYPFGVTGLTYDEIAARVQAFDLTEPLLRSGPDPEPFTVHADSRSDHYSGHDDIWNPQAAGELRFDGVELRLPRVRLYIDGDREPETLQATVRFSPLGNHYLRLVRRIEGDGLDPHELQQAMFRAAREHGVIDVRCGESSGSWPRLSQFAQDLLKAGLMKMLAPATATHGLVPMQSPVHRDLDVPEIHLGRSHVLLTVLQASAYRPGTDTAPETIGHGDALLAAFGSTVLRHVVPNCKETIGDWSRYSATQCKIIRDIRNEGDILVATGNSTVVAMLDSPSFVSGTLEAVGEFTATFDGALEAWNQRLNHYRRTVLGIIDEYDSGKPSKTQLPTSFDAPLQQMREERARLVHFESGTRRAISTLYSSNFLRSPSDTVALQQLLAFTGIDDQVQTFRERLGEVATDQFEATLQRWTGERQLAEEQLAARRRESASIALAAVGVCAAFQIWQAADFWPQWVWGSATLATVTAAGFSIAWLLRPVVAHRVGGWLARHLRRRGGTEILTVPAQPDPAGIRYRP
jgi:hypothetical protein